MRTSQSAFSIGNPVDSWWNYIRADIGESIKLLAYSPTYDTPEDAAKFLTTVETHYRLLLQAPFPKEATPAREHLVSSLAYLCDSFRSQSQFDCSDSERSYALAYQKFTLFAYTLLNRGVYEPDPTGLQSFV